MSFSWPVGVALLGMQEAVELLAAPSATKEEPKEVMMIPGDVVEEGEDADVFSARAKKMVT